MQDVINLLHHAVQLYTKKPVCNNLNLLDM